MHGGKFLERYQKCLVKEKEHFGSVFELKEKLMKGKLQQLRRQRKPCSLLIYGSWSMNKATP